jgi:branched-subunit amino acid ABC-type transport system permease component
MGLLIGALTIGLTLPLLALGLFISFRIFEFPDTTADGSSTLGAAVATASIPQLSHGKGSQIDSQAPFLDLQHGLYLFAELLHRRADP